MKLWIDNLKLDLSSNGIEELLENPLIYGGDRKYRNRYLKTHLLYHNCFKYPRTKKYIYFWMNILFLQMKDYDEVEKWNKKIFDEFCKDDKQPNPEILMNYYSTQGKIEIFRKNWNNYFDLRHKELDLLIDLKGKKSSIVVTKYFDIGKECFENGGKTQAIYYLQQYLQLCDLVENNEEKTNKHYI